MCNCEAESIELAYSDVRYGARTTVAMADNTIKSVAIQNVEGVSSLRLLLLTSMFMWIEDQNKLLPQNQYPGTNNLESRSGLLKDDGMM